MPLSRAGRIPVATYRLQLNRDRTFASVHDLVPYFRALGVDTLYLSPILLSAPGSTHGYDVNDYRRIDPELGGRDGFERLSARLREAGLGVVLDFVPNHMGIEGTLNTWWREVLESGEDSPHARFFDIFWTSHPRTKIHLPVLEDHYGRVLEAGKLRLEFKAGELALTYGQTTYPLSLTTYAKVLKPLTLDPGTADGTRAALVEWIADASALTPSSSSSRRRHAKDRAAERAALKTRLRQLAASDPTFVERLSARLERLNGAVGHPRSFDGLHTILERQHYRLARWQTGAHQGNYRRFFAVDSLVGLHMEHPDVFRDSHALVRQLMANDQIHGLRIDHIDGLWDPQEYLDRLQTLAAETPTPGDPVYVVVEKILAANEMIPEAWRTHGTTGYEFIGTLAGLFVDGSAEERFGRLYQEFTGRTQSFHQDVNRSKHIVEDDVLASTTMVLAARLGDLIERDRRWRDLSRNELRIALREIMACFRVYRTYRRIGAPLRPEDRREMDDAVTQAIRRNPLVPTEAFDFVRAVLTDEYPGPDAAADYRMALARWTLTFQQHTGAVMAKAMEDQAFYTFNQFIALNEVGGEPARFARPVDDFHRANEVRRRWTPHSLNATATHDTKFGEDVRARLYALSEIGEEWESWVREWSTTNRRHKTFIDGDAAPDANEEYRIYQVLVGVWPLDPGEVNDDFRARIRDYAAKCANEAHVHSAWTQPNQAWLSALEAFVTGILSDNAARGFLESIAPKAARLAHLGVVNSLAQLTLKVFSPGVPDFYQGTETWSLTLVDPDNRRAIAFDSLVQLAERCAGRPWPDLLRDWRDGGVKLRLTRDLVGLRLGRRSFFDEADYRALLVRGELTEHVVAFARTKGDDDVIVVVPRLTVRIGVPPIGAVWKDTTIETGRDGAAWKDHLTGRTHRSGKALLAADVFADLPVAVLVRE